MRGYQIFQKVIRFRGTDGTGYLSPLLVLISPVFSRGFPVFSAMEDRWGRPAVFILKFRTMTRAENVGNACPSRQRRYRTGGVMLQLQPDELPQFFNVLKGT